MATHFYTWVTQPLLEYILKGVVQDDKCLKNPDQLLNYFNGLIHCIQDIRTLEQRPYH